VHLAAFLVDRKMSLFTVFGGKARQGLTRQQQVDALRAANPYAAPAREDPANSWDIGLKLPTGMIVRVRTTLPDGFPDVAPTVSIVERTTSHPWLDADQKVIRSPELAAWTRERNLGQTVLSIIQHFGTNPPVFTPAPQPLPFPQSGGPLAGGAGVQGMMQGGAAGGAAMPRQGYPSGLPAPIHAPQGGQAGQQLPSQTPIQLPPGQGGQQQQQGANGLTSGMSQLTLTRRDSLSREITLAELTTSRSSSSANGNTLPPQGGHPSLQHGTSTHTVIPPIPSSFPQLEAMSLDELNLLLEDDSARTAFLASSEEYRVFETLAASQREAAGSAATSNIATAAQLKAAGEELKKAQEKTKAKQAELQALIARQQAACERFSAPKLARELETTASKLNQLSEEHYEAFSSSVSFSSSSSSSTASMGMGMSFYGGGSVASGDSTPGAASVASSTAGGPSGAGGGVDPRLRKFSEEFIALRKRYHIARAKGYILNSVGMSGSSEVAPS
jgi:Modifier of rudimentary (Mod(r)) protein